MSTLYPIQGLEDALVEERQARVRKAALFPALGGVRPQPAGRATTAGAADRRAVSRNSQIKL